MQLALPFPVQVFDLQSAAQSAANEFGFGDVWRRISSLFGLMEIADSEIAQAKVRYPWLVDRIDAAYMILVPAPMFESCVSALYRAHCRELLDRVAMGADTRLGTDAEALLAFSEASLEVALSIEGAAAMALLFNRCLGNDLPDIASSLEGLIRDGEQLAGRDVLDYLIEGMKRRMTQRDRVCPPSR